MRVGILTTEFPTHGTVGGLSAYCWELYRALESSGHEPHVLLRTDEAPNPGFAQAPSVHRLDAGAIASLLPFPLGRGSSVLLGRRIARWVADLSLDVLEAADVGSLAGWIPIPLPNRAALVLRLHTGRHVLEQYATAAPPGLRARLAERAADLLERRTIARADAVSAVSRAVAERTFRDLRIPPREVTIIPNPASRELLEREPVTAEVPHHVVCLGRLARVKGVDLLIEAWPRVLSAVPGAHLTIAGEDTSTAPDGGSMREYLARRITELGVNSSVHLVGYVPHEAVPSLLDSAALCVFPSRWEGMPVSVVEAMARGKCVIVSRAPAMVEVVDDAVSGVIADAEDPMVFATAIVNLLADAERRARLGKAAREKAAREFAVDVVLDRTLALYRDAQRKRAAQ